MGIILFLSSLPFFISLFLGFNLTSQILYYKQKARHICQSYNLAHQKQLKLKLQTLLKLNPEAKKLRLQLNSAKKALKLATISNLKPAMAVAQAFLNVIIAKQLVLNVKQKKILSKAIFLVKKVKKQLKKKLDKAFNKKTITKYSYRQLGLAVYPKPLSSLSPSYYTLPTFSHVQASYSTFKINIASLLNPVFKQVLGSYNIFKISCSASLVKERKIQISLW